MLESCEKELLNAIIEAGVIDEDIYNLVKNRYGMSNSSRPLSSVDDLVFMHKTDYFPRNNMLLTARSGNRISLSYYRCDNERYDYLYDVPRDNLFFTINCIVQSHEDGDFNRKLAIIVDGGRMDLSKTVYANPIDYAVNSNIYLGRQNDQDNSAFILCPPESLEEIKNNNDQSIVIGYEGISLDCAAETIMMLLGKKIEKYGPIKYADSNDDLEYIAPILEKLSLKPRIGLEDNYECYATSECGFMEEIKLNIQQMKGIIKAANERGQNLTFVEVERSIVSRRRPFNFRESNISFELYKDTVISELGKEGYDLGSKLDSLKDYSNSVLEYRDEMNPNVASFLVENLRTQYGNGWYVLYYIPVNNGAISIRFTPEYIVEGNKILYDMFSQQYKGEATYSNSESNDALENQPVQKRK